MRDYRGSSYWLVLLFDTQQLTYDYEAQEPSKAELGLQALLQALGIDLDALT